VTASARILDRLERVRQTGAGRWIASCPAHSDRLPSLSIRKLDDGRVLIHCFAGCGAADVVTALGLGLSDLFDKPLGDYRPSRTRIPASDLLVIISEETLVIATVATDILSKKHIAETDWQRLATAAARIGRARDYVCGQ
jgi:hypothetical protein